MRNDYQGEPAAQCLGREGAQFAALPPPPDGRAEKSATVSGFSPIVQTASDGRPGFHRKGMAMKSIASILAAAGLVVASTASAAAVPAIPPDARMSSPVLAAEAEGDSTWLWLAGGAVLLVLLFVLVLDDDDEDDLPTSP